MLLGSPDIPKLLFSKSSWHSEEILNVLNVLDGKRSFCQFEIEILISLFYFCP